MRQGVTGDETFVRGFVQIEGVNDSFSAVIKSDSKELFDYDILVPVKIKDEYRGYVPWGVDNLQPKYLLEKIRADEVMCSNIWFNIQTAYGLGFKTTNTDESPVTDPEILKFFRRNNMIKFWAEQFTDIKHFFFSVVVIILDVEGKRVVQIRHKEAVNCRFETCNPDTGKIENIFYANWEALPSKDFVDVIPVLDEDDPIGDLMVRLGKEPDPHTGMNNEATAQRMFAIVNRIPTPGMKYYPFAYYFSTFNSGWSDLKAMIPIAKKAMMRNGMAIKYIVEMHRDYFFKLFESEKIVDAEKKKKRKTEEINNIKNFLSGIDNQNKSWFSTYYVDPNGKENKMVRIERIDQDKAGGDYIVDSETATNIVSYAMGVHPSLIGSSPGANKAINGTESRELFTMKQALEHLTRDLMLQPFHLLNDVNGWELTYSIPDLMLTTLDKKTDAKPVDTNNLNPNDPQNAK